VAGRTSDGIAGIADIARHRRHLKGKVSPLINTDDTDREQIRAHPRLSAVRFCSCYLPFANCYLLGFISGKVFKNLNFLQFHPNVVRI